MVLCDWLSIHQTHYGIDMPVINNGSIFCVDEFGEIEWTTTAKFEHVGSYDTKIRIRSDGHSIHLDGNIGRLNRTDNVFGFSVSECIALANKILSNFNLPAFTEKKFNTSSGRLDGGASITRIDLTRNYSAGNQAKAVRLVHYLGGQDAGKRATVKQYGNTGVVWNEGSKFQSSKLYIKAESMGSNASPELIEFVKQNGIVRHEISIKSRYLQKHQLQDIATWKIIDAKAQTMDNIIYGRFTEVLTRGTAIRTQLEDIEGRFGHIALAWMAGKDVWGDNCVTLRTRQMWRKKLLPYGIDIKQPSNITRINSRIEVITLQDIEAPTWYWQQSQMKVA